MPISDIENTHLTVVGLHRDQGNTDEQITTSLCCVTATCEWCTLYYWQPVYVRNIYNEIVTIAGKVKVSNFFYGDSYNETSISRSHFTLLTDK